MEFSNYAIIFNQINEDNVFIKFTDKTTNISYKGIITSEQLDNININKFVKMFNNCVNMMPNYNISIQIITDKNEMVISLVYDTDMISITENIHLSQDIVSDSDILSGLHAKIKHLEQIISDSNKITIAKIFELKTQNYNFVDVKNSYIKYSQDTTHIETILPDNTYNTSTGEQIGYELAFNYDVDPAEIFVNLKKITLSDPLYIYYFCSFCHYFGQVDKSNASQHKIPYNIVIYNNNIEEIIIVRNDRNLNLTWLNNNILDCIRGCSTNETQILLGKIYLMYLKKQNYFIEKPLYLDNFKPLCPNENKIFSFPKLTKITWECICSPDEFYFLTTCFVTYFKKLKHLQINKIDFSKYAYSVEPERRLGVINSCATYVSDIRKYCADNNIRLEIGEIINV